MAMSEVVSYGEFKGSSTGERKPIEAAVETPSVVEAPTKEAEPEAVVKEEHKEETVKRSYEEDARAKGWKPKDEFEGDPDDWTPAKSWLKTGEILDSFHSFKRQTKETLEELVKQNAEVERKTYEKAYRDAEERQRKAAEVGNVKEVQAVTKELMDLAPKMTAAPVVPQGSTPEAEVFKYENRDWFNQSTPENVAMQAYAIAIDNEVATKHKELSNAKKLELVRAEVKKAFPHRFEGAVVHAREVLPTASAPTKKVASDDFSSMPEHHKRIMRKLEKDLGGKFDRKAYMHNVKLIGDR